MHSRTPWLLSLVAVLSAQLACATLHVEVPEPAHCDPDKLDAPLEQLVLEVSAPDARSAGELVETLRENDGPLLFVDDLSSSDLALSLRPEIPECVRLADQGRRGDILESARLRVQSEGLTRACALPIPGCKLPTPLAALAAQGSYRPAAFSLDARHRFVVLQYACTDAGALRSWLYGRRTPRGVSWGRSHLPAKEPARRYFACPQASGPGPGSPPTTRLSDEPLARHGDTIDHAVPEASCWLRLEGTTRLSQAELFINALEDLGTRPSGSCVAQEGAVLCPLTCGDDSRRDLETLSNTIEGAPQSSGNVEVLGMDPLGHVLMLRLTHP